MITIVAAAGLEENQEGLGEVMVMGSGDATDEALGRNKLLQACIVV